MFVTIAQEDSLTQQPQNPIYLGLDVGTRRIGVAVASPGGLYALPLETVNTRDRKAGYARLVEIITSREVTHIIVGWPLTLDGKIGRATERVERFVDALKSRLDEPLPTFIQWDERLTTIAAEGFLLEADVSRDRRKDVVDQIAATHILEGYLQSIAAEQGDGPEQ